MNQQSENSAWYALRVTFCREMLVKSKLDEMEVENYVPMHWTELTVGGRKIRSWQPLIHNLIFVHLTGNKMKELKARSELPICYIMNHAEKCPIVIPEEQMHAFMALVALRETAQVEVVNAGLADLKNGELVRITDGLFKGIVGRCIKSNSRRRVAVELEGIATALTTYIPMKYLKRIE